MNVGMAIARAMLALFVILPMSLAQAISEQMEQMVLFETKANAVTTRDNKVVALEHYEIPLRLLESDISKSAPPAYVRSMVFEKDGEKFVRWVLNPDDTKWHFLIRRFLKENHLPNIRHKYFQGYRTASRSYIVVDPVSGAEFSLKTSTNNTGGYWADKKQYWDDSSQIRKLSEYVRERLAAQPELKHAIILDEPMAFGIKNTGADGATPKDISIIMRSYQDMARKGVTYIPGFSVLHTEFGKKLAAKNGSSDPATYWNENYNKPLARALAEFFAATGVRYDSPHSQNFLVEVDKDMKPTGKIVLRDFGDSYLYEKFFKANQNLDILKIWEQENVRRSLEKDYARKNGDIAIDVGTLHGNKAPVWIDYVNDLKSTRSYDQWGRDFFTEFESEFKKQTGITLGQISEEPRRSQKEVSKDVVLKTGYFTKQYKLFVDTKFLEMVFKDRQRETGAAGTCQRLLLAM